MIFTVSALRGPFIQSSKSPIKTPNSVKPIRIRIGTNVNALVNTTINIVCQVAGLPVPVTSWSYNDKVLRRGRLIVKGTTLTIPKAQMDDEGVYACTASSAAGNLTVKSQILLNGKLSKPHCLRRQGYVFLTLSLVFGDSFDKK